MKKIVLFILVFGLLICISACGYNDSKSKQSATPSAEQSNESEKYSEKYQIIDADWGVDENTITEKNDVMARAHIKFPSLAGITKGQGKIAYQTDGSLVILGSENDYEEPTVEEGKVENIFPAYFEKIIGTIKLYRGVDYTNFKFEILDKEIISINDYEMCKYIGTHTFTVSGDEKSISYVAYATKLKANDAAVYWMVLDDTEDQSLGSTIESHADKMAESLYE